MADPILLKHRPCGTVVLHYDHPPAAGEAIQAQHATHPNGADVEAGHALACETCRRPVPLADLAQ